MTRLLNSTLKLSGGETDTTKLSNGKNIGVVANKDNDGLDIKLAKDLTDIDSINMTGGLKLKQHQWLVDNHWPDEYERRSA